MSFHHFHLFLYFFQHLLFFCNNLFLFFYCQQIFAILLLLSYQCFIEIILFFFKFIWLLLELNNSCFKFWYFSHSFTNCNLLFINLFIFSQQFLIGFLEFFKIVFTLCSQCLDFFIKFCLDICGFCWLNTFFLHVFFQLSKLFFKLKIFLFSFVKNFRVFIF